MLGLISWGCCYVGTLGSHTDGNLMRALKHNKEGLNTSHDRAETRAAMHIRFLSLHHGNMPHAILSIHPPPTILSIFLEINLLFTSPTNHTPNILRNKPKVYIPTNHTLNILRNKPSVYVLTNHTTNLSAYIPNILRKNLQFTSLPTILPTFLEINLQFTSSPTILPTSQPIFPTFLERTFSLHLYQPYSQHS